MIRILFAAFFAVFSPSALSAELTAYTSEGSVLVFQTIDGETYPEKVDIHTTKGTLCAESAIVFEDIYLWMKMGNHEHGTSPVEVERTSVRCVNLSNLDFLMPGSWQLRVMSDKGNAVFLFEVVR